MSQSKKNSALEVLTNQVLGIATGWLLVYFVFPILDPLKQWQVATISTAMFFVSSSTRLYVIRRVFSLLD